MSTRRVGLAVGLVAMVLVAGGATMIWSAPDGARVAASRRAMGADAAAYVPRPLEEVYPAALIASYQDLVAMQFPEEQIPIQERDDGPVVYATRADTLRRLVASSARAQGLAYEERDLLTPVRNGKGVVVGYTASNVGRIISVEEASRPAFDLCALQVAEVSRAMAIAGARGVEVPGGSVRQQVGC